MADELLRIGELAERAGVSPRTVDFQPWTDTRQPSTRRMYTSMTRRVRTRPAFR